MAQFFDDIEEWDRSIEKMFEFVAEVRWITLLYNDTMDHNKRETWIRYYIFDVYTNFLIKLHASLCNARQANNLFFSILKAQLQENLIRRNFKRFENHNAFWHHFNIRGFCDTVHYPLIRYQEYAATIHDQIICLQECCDVFSNELERAIIFYRTTHLMENIIEARENDINAMDIGRKISQKIGDLRRLQDQQTTFYIELMQMKGTFANR